MEGIFALLGSSSHSMVAMILLPFVAALNVCEPPNHECDISRKRELADA